jgi:trehalose 6-phosphate synthase/phosphatase
MAENPIGVDASTPPATSTATNRPSRLVVVSNRLPFTVSVRAGRPQFNQSAGGLTTGLWSYLQQAARALEPLNHVWLGWPGSDVAAELQQEVTQFAREKFSAVPLYLPEESMDRFYHGFCNRTLWPLFHYFPSLTRYEEENWDQYRRINAQFAEALIEELRPDDVLWVHDYQLMLVPALVRAKFPDMPIGFFLHIPFPSFELFRLLPAAWRTELIEGLLGSSLVGFHTHDYAAHFLTSVVRTVGCEHQLGTLTLRERVVKVDTFPMGIAFDQFAEAAVSKDAEESMAEMRTKCAGKKVIFSVDRLDYTKGMLNRLRGYDLFLKNNPEWHGKVVFVLSVAPSRTSVETYQTMKHELDRVVGRILGAYADVNWTPVIYQYRTLTLKEIAALYRLCDVALITPLRDGMNLVAKEFIASRPDQTGVLILSELAGAAKEMGEAVLINPHHREEIARALETALAMPVEEQIRRNRLLQDRLRRYDVNRWADDFVQALMETQTIAAAQRARSLTGRARSALIQQYHAARRRTLFLDYDGTLVPFMGNPKQAQPDAEVLELLAVLGNDPANEVVVVSGRTRVELQEWFGRMPVSLIAEHGVWLRPMQGEWRLLKDINTDWKQKVRPILQFHADRLPGALLEEKEFSLAWHYRQADPEQGAQQAKELMDDLAGYTRNIDVQVLEGNKVFELRNTGVTKGTAAQAWIASQPADFILAVGDDRTDEDLFRAMPPSAFSVRVGLAQTAARYHLGNHMAVRRLLRELGCSRTEEAVK